MELLQITFAISGIKTHVFVPPLFSFAVSFFTSMAGISGAFLLLPFQMSFLGFTSPSVSSTNLFYNITGIPGGVYRYVREGRMCWPLALAIISGAVPGVLAGYYIRIMLLPDPRIFKIFVGIVLLYIGSRLLKSLMNKNSTKGTETVPISFRIENVSYGLRKVSYDFSGERISFNTMGILLLSCIVGIIGGVYGIGGGSVIAPFCITFFNLPVYTVAGAVLMGTFVTSFAGVIFYTFVPINGLTAQPDWLLGLLFGTGGLLGMYSGAKLQKYMPERLIKLILGIIILSVSLRYIFQFFR